MIECDWCGARMRLGDTIHSITRRYSDTSLSDDCVQEICQGCATQVGDMVKTIIRFKEAKESNQKVGEFHVGDKMYPMQGGEKDGGDN